MHSLLHYLLTTLIFTGRREKAKVLFRKTGGMRNYYLESSFVKASF